MKLNEYQEKAMTTCMPSSNNLVYMFFNLLGEVGELTEKVNVYFKSEQLDTLTELLGDFSALAKKIRKEPDAEIVKELVASGNREVKAIQQDILLHKELGDIEWQLNGLMTVLGLKAEDICQQNLDKLASRQKRNQIDGNGDVR